VAALVPALRQQEVQRFSDLIHGAIEMDPLAFHLDVRLIHPPGSVRGPLAPACIFRELTGIALYPPIKRGMIDPDTSLGHDLLKVTAGNAVAQ